MSDTIWVAIITACAAIIPQAIQSFYKYKLELKISEFQFYSKSKQDAVNNFIDVVLDKAANKSDEANFYKSLNKVAIFTNEKSFKLLKNVKYASEVDADAFQINEHLMKFVSSLNESNNIKSKKKI